MDVSPSELHCPNPALQQYVYQSEAAEVTRLECGPGAGREILEDLELSKVGEVGVSVKMIGCSTTRVCTPVLFSFESLISSSLDSLFSFSFSYTYTKAKTLKNLDLIGCTDLENLESLWKIKEITKAEAINLFHYEGELTKRAFKRYIYYPKTHWRVIQNSTNQRNVENINLDLSQKEIVKVSKDAFWSEVTNSYQIEMLNLSHNSIQELPQGIFPNSTFSNTKYLDLSFNILSTLGNNIFENLTSVEDLNLAGSLLICLIKYIASIFGRKPTQTFSKWNLSK